MAHPLSCRLDRRSRTSLPRITVLFAGIVLVAALAASTQGTSEEPPPPEPSPTADAGTDAPPDRVPSLSDQTVERVETNLIRIEPAVLDLGVVQAGSSAKGVIRLVNDGPDPVRIVKTKASCGCTAAKVPSDVIFPNERVEIAVSLRTSGQAGGELTKQVTFVLDGDHPPLRARVTARTDEVIVVERSPLVLDGQTDQLFTLTATDDVPFRIAAIPALGVMAFENQTASTRHEIVLTAEQRTGLGKRQALRVDLDHPRARSVLLSLKLPDHAKSIAAASNPWNRRPALPTRFRQATENIRVSDMTPMSGSPLQIIPRRIDLGTLDDQSCLERQLLVRNMDSVVATNTGRLPADTRLRLTCPGLDVQVVDHHVSDQGLVMSVQLSPEPTWVASSQSKLTVSLNGQIGSCLLSFTKPALSAPVDTGPRH